MRLQQRPDESTVIAVGTTGDDRRTGPSRLSTWSGRRIAWLWIVWPGIVLAIVAVAVFVSVRLQRGFDEVRVDLTRTNLIGLIAVIIVPPGCLTALWWRMRGRRRRSEVR